MSFTNQQLINTAILAVGYLILFASAEVLYHKFKVKAEITRKIVHLSTGIISLLFPPMLGNHWLVLGLCFSFLIILLSSLKFKLLPSINAVERTTRGSIIYPFIVYGAFLVLDYYDDMIFYYIPILILALADPVAGLLGKKIPKGEYTIFNNTKTLTGSFAFFVTAFAIALFFLFLFSEKEAAGLFIVAFLVSVFTAFAEAISHKGYDNLTIPATATVVLVFCHEMTAWL